jgi:ribosomal protein L17
MTHHTPKDLSLKLERVADAFAGDVDAMSDAQILQEAKEDGIDTETLAADLRSSAFSLIAQAKRQRLAQARSALAASQQSRALKTRVRPTLDMIKQRIQDVLTIKPSLAIAFRDGREMSDDDWISLWDDFVEMGAVKDGDDAP